MKLVLYLSSCIYLVILKNLQTNAQLDLERHGLTEDVLTEMQKYAPVALRLSAKWLTATLQKEAEYAGMMKRTGRASRTSNPFSLSKHFLGGSPTSKQMSYSSFLQTKFQTLLSYKFPMGRRSFRILIDHLPALLTENDRIFVADTDMVIPPPYMCPYPKTVVCDARSKYRTMDGCCNNLKNPLWGSQNQPMQRLLKADYGDEIDSPRVAKSGNELPNPRLVSTTIHGQTEKPSDVHTLMMMLFGQFVDHDCARTAVSKLTVDENGMGGVEDVMCGTDECQDKGLENQNCLPIPVPKGDRAFSKKKCIPFVRTLQVPKENCVIGSREQMSQVTMWLDSSQVYGSSKNEAKVIRDKSPNRGKLLMTSNPNFSHKSLLPKWPEFEDCMSPSEVKCFRAGDGRVNEHTGLMCLHTIFAREHNRIEENLHEINPHWDGERLYQESRRILNAQYQNIIYSEFLPLLLGPEIMQRFKLNVKAAGYTNVYDPDERGNTLNAFSTAAFRYGHSQIRSLINLVGPRYESNSALNFSDTMRDPDLVYTISGPDLLMRGFLQRSAKRVDQHISAEVTDRLFRMKTEKIGLDLATINIMRGRDHGIPGYNSWREACLLGRVTSFDALKDSMDSDIVEKFKTLYESVDDIDLFPAGLAEYPARNALVGPTFACIIGEQFSRSKRADRFWFENNVGNPGAFTPDQLASIRKASLAKIICNNADNIDQIQPRVLIRPFRDVWWSIRAKTDFRILREVYSIYHGEWNERVECDKIDDIDFNNWLEMPPFLNDQRQGRPYSGNINRQREHQSSGPVNIRVSGNHQDMRMEFRGGPDSGHFNIQGHAYGP